MPTFRSIGVHPDLRKRLCVATRPAGGDSAGGDAEQQQQQPSSSSSSPLLVPIATPYALLSRPPGSLRLATNERLESSKPIALAQVESLRHDVAVAMLQSSKTGRYWKRIAQTCRAARRSAAEASLDDDDDHGGMNDDDEGNHDNQGIKAMFPSAFDLLQYQQTELIPRRIALSTGCRSLDRAIALPAEFAAYASPTPLAPTVRQVNGTIDKTNTNRNNDDDDNDDQTTGIPFGFITQLTGPPGSGKSQLAQHVALASARLGGTVWYLHSSAQPFLSATTSTAPSTTPQVLDRIVVAPARDAYGLLRRLAELEDSLQQQEVAPAATAKTTTTGSHDAPPPSATVLIVDSCSVCLAATDDETLYATVSSTIKRLTREYDLATLLTIGTVGADRQPGSGVTGGGYNNVKAALGHFWSGVADIEVWLEPVPVASLNTIKATVPRHFAKESSTLVHHFAIRESGIVEVGKNR